MTTKVARQVAGGYIVLPRSAYAHLQRYGKNARYVVDAVEYANWSIGRDLRRERLAAGLTQAEVAPLCRNPGRDVVPPGKRPWQPHRRDGQQDRPRYQPSGSAEGETAGPRPVATGQHPRFLAAPCSVLPAPFFQ
jgi:hypothetical protein